jgi:pyruvate/2-oxoglutarate dehydrogenase complex dihydrolipoamide acyltransferase (E2) component
MDVEIKMPKLGLTMESGAVTRWLKQPGDLVREGEPLLEIESEKSQCEVEAPVTGRLHEIRAQINDEIPVGGVLGLITAD